MKLKLMIAGLGGVVGLLILFGVITGMLRISMLDNPEETEHKDILSKMEETGNLELIHYNFDESPGTVNQTDPGSQSARTGGEAAACINLNDVSSSDISVERDKVIIYLPSPELCYAKVAKNRSGVSQAGLSPGEEPSERNIDYGNYEQNLREKAVSLGIYDQAKKNAEKLVHALLSSVTDKEIVLKFRN